MIVLQNMGGIAPKTTPELLPDNLAQAANNAIVTAWGEESWPSVVRATSYRPANVQTSTRH